MEFYTVKALSALLKPPGSFAVLMLLTALTARRRPRLARGLGFGGAALILALSAGRVSDALLASLSRYPPVDGLQLRDVQAIVILGGGVQRDLADYGGGTVTPLALERLRYGARLARESDLPVLVTDGALNGRRPGAQYMAEALLDWGVHAHWIEPRALTTYDNARYAWDMLAPEGIDRVALVSHGWHLPRAVAIFERVGFQVVPAPTLVVRNRQAEPLDWLPDVFAFERSMVALYEYLGGAWYRLRYGTNG